MKPSFSPFKLSLITLTVKNDSRLQINAFWHNHINRLKYVLLLITLIRFFDQLLRNRIRLRFVPTLSLTEIANSINFSKPFGQFIYCTSLKKDFFFFYARTSGWQLNLSIEQVDFSDRITKLALKYNYNCMENHEKCTYKIISDPLTPVNTAQIVGGRERRRTELLFLFLLLFFFLTSLY